jgi:hypothetical protein
MRKARPGEGGGPKKGAKDNKRSHKSLSTSLARSARGAERPHFVLVLRPEPGVDGTRALRRFLKVALRSFGLHCIRAEEVRQAEAAP